MRLWHVDLIPILPRQQLCGQHRECSALRGLGWGKKHSVVNYVFNHSWENLFYYHCLIMKEMENRKYQVNQEWKDFYYRGKNCERLNEKWTFQTNRKCRYPEHNDEYLRSCIINLSKKIRNAPEGKYDINEIYRFFAWVQERNLIIE